jgi:aminoglycoside phosphotransferase (APT) family kinase protein
MELVGKEETPQLTALTGGVSSLIVLAKTALGLLCVKQALPRLKVAQEWYAPVARNQAEVAWLRVAAQIAADSVPRILGEDAQTLSFAMEFLDPATYPVWKEQLRDGVIERQTARLVAERLAAIHGATAGRPDLAARFANDDTFHALRLESYFVAAARSHADVAAALHRLVKTTSETRYALVHGDISPKNILVGPSGPVFLDAECAWYGDPAFDLAFCLNHLLLKCVWRPEQSGRYLDCFAILAHTYIERVSWEPAPVLEARAAGLLAGMLLARIDGKSPVEYITDERDRAAVRRFAKARLLDAPGRLQEIGQDWASEWKLEWERRD